MDRPSQKVEHLVAVLVFLACSLALYGQALGGDAAFFVRDVLNYYWPKRMVAAEAWSRGEIPVWDPTHGAGLPLLGDIHAAVLNPLNQLHQILAFPTAYALQIVICHVGGGLGAYLVARAGKAGLAPALGAGIAFMLSGYVVGLCNAGPLMCGAALVPWTVLAVACNRGLAARVALLGCLLAAQALCGDPQSVLFSAVACALYGAWHPPRVRNLGALGGGLALAGALAAVQLVPAWTTFSESTRAGAGTNIAQDWAMHPMRLVELAFAFPYGGYLERPQFWAWFSVKGPATTPFALSVYLGLGACLIALLGVARDRRTGFCLTLLGIGLGLALAPHLGLGSLYGTIPPLKFFRYPEKYVFLCALGMAWLLAGGMERLIANRAGARPLWALAGLVVLLGGLLAACWLARPQLVALTAGPLARLGVRGDAQAPVLAAQSSAMVGLGVSCLVLALLALSRKTPRRSLVAALALLIVFADLFVAARRTVWLGPTRLYQRDPPMAAELRRLAPIRPFRVFRDESSIRGSAPHSRTLAEMTELREWELATMKSNLPGRFGIEEVSSYGAVELARHHALAAELGSQLAKLGGIFNGCLVVAPRKLATVDIDPHLRVVASSARLAASILENDLCVPRVYLVGHVIGASSAQEAVKSVSQSTFDLKKEAVVEGMESQAFAESAIVASQVSGRGARVEVGAADGGAFVVLSASWYPGWRVTIDGQAAPLRAVNGAVMGAAVPAGRHVVEFAFSERGLPAGAATTLIGLLIAGWLLVLDYRTSRRANATDAATRKATADASSPCAPP